MRTKRYTSVRRDSRTNIKLKRWDLRSYIWLVVAVALVSSALEEREK